MKLKSLKIKGFKNLSGKNPDDWFEIDFEKKDGVTVLVGNNGSGKSNVLEAVSAIFSGLYKKDKKVKEIEEFELGYSIIIDNKKGAIYDASRYDEEFSVVDIKIIQSKKSINLILEDGSKVSLKNFDTFLPSQIIALYSGEETRLYEKYYKKPYDDFINKGISNIYENPHFFFIDEKHWELAIISMLASDNTIIFNEVLKNKEAENISIDLHKKNIEKFYKLKPTSNVNILAKAFLDSGKTTFTIEEFKNLANTSHYDLYQVLAISLFNKDERNKLFNSIDILFTDGTTVRDLSEGEKKQILLYFALDFLADKNSLILLDEPDSYIHVGNKDRIKEMFKKFKNGFGESGEIILTTHSPTLIHCFDSHHRVYLEDGKILSKDKSEVLKEISGDKMSFTQQQIILNTDKDILIVEGKTDETYIQTALEKLKPDNPKYKDLNFEFLYIGGSDADVINRLIEKFTPKKGQDIIVFLDHDAYDKAKKVCDYTGEKKNFNEGEKNGVKIYLYPEKANFTKNDGKQFCAEDYFALDKFTAFLMKDIECFQDIPQKNKRKTDFAEACKNFPPEDFEGFKALFDLILKIK